jgi:hypothetical protein
MPPDAVVYVVNLIIGAILAGLMSQHWRRSPGSTAPGEDPTGGDSLRYWIAAAWTLTLADLLFVARAGFTSGALRALPTLTVTAGHAVLLLAALRTSGRPAMPRVAVATVVLHAAALLAFLELPEGTSWRTVTNGIVWGGLSLAAAVVLWRDPQRARRAMQLPMLVLAAQGGFHAVRTLLATRVAVRADDSGRALVQLLGDFEVSLFMVALFVSVLVAYLRQRNVELRAALDDVRQLSSMLPVCAWCRKVRDDQGYWNSIEQYLAAHRVNVTHALCESCAATHFAPAPAPSPTAR